MIVISKVCNLNVGSCFNSIQIDLNHKYGRVFFTYENIYVVKRQGGILSRGWRRCSAFGVQIYDRVQELKCMLTRFYKGKQLVKYCSTFTIST